MMIRSLLAFALYSLFATVAYSRPATKCDLDAINRRIAKLREHISKMNEALKSLDAANTDLNNNVKKIQGSAYQKKEFEETKKYILNDQAAFEKQFATHLYWHKRNLKSVVYGFEYSAIKQAYNEKYYPEYKELLSNQSKELNDVREVVRRIYKQNDWRVVRDRLKAVTAFKGEVEGYQSVSFQQLEDVDASLYLVTRQSQLQQFNENEKLRSDANSGIKQIHNKKVGERIYHANDHTGKTFAGINNDEDHTRRDVGVEPFIAVLNGMEFKTNVFSYPLRKPAQDKTYQKTQDIQFPAVPGSIGSLQDVDEQISEMRDLFKSFQQGNKDVGSAFKPIMTYLEGSWTSQMGNQLEQIKSQYESNIGFHNTNSPSKFQASSIMGFDENENPSYTKWNYRLLSHPIQTPLKPSQFLMQGSVVSRQRHGISDSEYNQSAMASFTLKHRLHNGELPSKQKPTYYTFLDALMEEIPGLDNYAGNIKATGFDASILSANPTKQGQDLNGAFYHRPYKLSSKDAMGVDTAQRSYSDHFYVALTTHNNVVGPKIKVTENGNTKEISSKVSYAIPFEVVYLTPLQTWNPYKVGYMEDCSLVTGAGTKMNPFSAACSERNFLTPQSFYTGNQECVQNNDELRSFYFKSTIQSTPVCLVASGVKSILPSISGIDERVRVRYPIMPVHGEGSSVWKKMNAIEDEIQAAVKENQKEVSFYVGESTHTKIGKHRHVISVNKQKLEELKAGTISSIVKPTEPNGKHQHVFTLTRQKVGHEYIVVASKCDSDPLGENVLCFDGHQRSLEEIK